MMVSVAVSAYCQMPIRFSVVPPVAPDSADLAYYGRRHTLKAAATVIGLNITVWAFDRYIQKGDFAYISWNSVKENFRHGFIWDNDRMGTNMFLHPYHGHLYYNAARANGFNYWRSGLFAFGGSAMWELFMENEYPSTNDIIATPIGGIILGEVAYRASDIILDDRATGWERVGREVSAAIASPMRGLVRIINGDAWLRRSTSGRQFGIPNVAVEFSAGIRMLEFRDEIFDKGSGFSYQLAIEYGERFEVKDSRPFDFFSLRVSSAIQASQPLLSQLNIMGRLLGREVIDKHGRYMSVGMYQYFDYYDSDTISDVSAKTPYKLGIPASVGVGAMYRDGHRSNFVFDCYAHCNSVILGAVLSDHYYLDERNYNLASGFSIKTGINMAFRNGLLSLSASNDFYGLYTWKGYPSGIDWGTVNYKTLNAQGDKSSAYFNVAELRADLRIWKKLYLTAVVTHYLRMTHYRDYENVRSSTSATQLMLSYKL